jgi:hypothetical protein
MALEVREKSASPVTNAVKCGQGRKAKPLSSWASVRCSRSRHTLYIPLKVETRVRIPLGLPSIQRAVCARRSPARSTR